MLGFKTNYIKNSVIKKLKRLTLIDYLVLLIVIGIGLFFVFKFSRKEKVVFIDLTFERVTPGNNFFPPEYWQVENISVEDVVYNSLGNKIATVKKIKKVPWGGGSRFYTYITLEIDVLYHVANHTYSYEGKPLAIGQQFTILINNASFTGIIKNIYTEAPSSLSSKTDKGARITLYCRDYESWHAEALKNFSVKDDDGNILAEVTKATITPAQWAVVTDDGRYIETRHPYKKDLELEIILHNLDCTRKGQCFYNETQNFSVGNQFWLNSEKTWLGQNCSVKDFTLLEP